MWTSVPQIDERRTRIKTSNSPTGGIGISSNQSPGPRSRFTSACIDLIVSGSLCGSLTSLGGDFSQVNESSGLCLLAKVWGKGWSFRLHLPTCRAHLSPLTSHLSPLTSHLTRHTMKAKAGAFAYTCQPPPLTSPLPGTP